MRWWFAITKGWKHRKDLKEFLTNKDKQIARLEEITPQKLDEYNIAILALDFDGALAGHNEIVIAKQVQEWLQTLSQHIGEQGIAILSNQPKSARLAWFKKHFPSIYFLQGARKKPYPDGILEVAEYKGIPVHRVALVDDRLLTGMLATRLAYCQGWYFINPKQNFYHSPLYELMFSLLRLLERIIIKIIG